MANDFLGPPLETFYLLVVLFMTIISAIAGAVNIATIYRMKQTGYIQLILYMSYFQLIYDALFYNGLIYYDYTLTTICLSVQIGSGVASSFISNWIALIVLYIIYYKLSFDILANFWLILSTSVIPSFLLFIFFVIGAITDNDTMTSTVWKFYYYVRLISIFANFIMTGIALYANYLMRSKGMGRTDAELAIGTLCRRMMYYPLVQAISRSGYAWYEFQYGFDFSYASTTGNPLRYTALLYSAVITPIASIGYLLVFLRIEPTAFEEFKHLLRCEVRHNAAVVDDKSGSKEYGNEGNKVQLNNDSSSSAENNPNPSDARQAPWQVTTSRRGTDNSSRPASTRDAASSSSSIEDNPFHLSIFAHDDVVDQDRRSEQQLFDIIDYGYEEDVELANASSTAGVINNNNNNNNNNSSGDDKGSHRRSSSRSRHLSAFRSNRHSSASSNNISNTASTSNATNNASCTSTGDGDEGDIVLSPITTAGVSSISASGTINPSTSSSTSSSSIRKKSGTGTGAGRPVSLDMVPEHKEEQDSIQDDR